MTASILSRYTLVSGCAYAGMHLSLMINPTTRDPKKEKLHIGLGVSVRADLSMMVREQF